MRKPDHRPNWGRGGKAHIEPLTDLILDWRINGAIDYGCGHGLILDTLIENGVLKRPITQYYDPGIEQYSLLPVPADLVICTDVLEHVEPEYIGNVIKHLGSLTLKVAYINIHTGPAVAVLPDGRNAHLIQRPVSWWEDKLKEVYRTVKWDGESDRRPTFICYP